MATLKFTSQVARLIDSDGDAIGTDSNPMHTRETPEYDTEAHNSVMTIELLSELLKVQKEIRLHLRVMTGEVFHDSDLG